MQHNAITETEMNEMLNFIGIPAFGNFKPETLHFGWDESISRLCYTTMLRGAR